MMGGLLRRIPPSAKFDGYLRFEDENDIDGSASGEHDE
jgi:hypothetical protein